MIRTFIQNILKLEISNKQVRLLMVVYLILYFGCLTAFIGLSHKLWTDEHHFLRAIEYFYNNTSLHSLKHYNELATPFTFIFYAWWAKLYVLEIEWLRIGSMIVASTCYLAIFKLFRLFFTRWISFLGMVFISLNPYMLGISFFVYTDMWAILAVVVAVVFLFKKYYFLSALALTFALWSRQYAVYQLSANCLFLIYVYYPSIKKIVGSISIMSLSFFSLIPLFILWGGFTPINEIRYVYIQTDIIYQWNGLWAYLASFTVYTFPIYFIWFVYHKINYRLLIVAFLLAGFYFLNPIQASECAVEASYDSIGFFDKFLKQFFTNKYKIDLIYYLFISFQIYYLIHCIKIIKNHPIFIFTILSMAMFLLIMPLSYIVWEKYILLLLPIYFLSLLKSISTLKIL
jgi:hypothetical protein